MTSHWYRFQLVISCWNRRTFYGRIIRSQSLDFKEQEVRRIRRETAPLKNRHTETHLFDKQMAFRNFVHTYLQKDYRPRVCAIVQWVILHPYDCKVSSFVLDQEISVASLPLLQSIFVSTWAMFLRHKSSNRDKCPSDLWLLCVWQISIRSMEIVSCL